MSGTELERWAQDHTIFISSEMELLKPERQELANALRGLGMRVVMFEDLGGRDETAERAYLDGVARSDIYVGVIGDRYGSMLESGRSPTDEEYREARFRGKRISVWSAKDGSSRQGNARDFLDEIRVFHTTGSFTSPEDLAGRVVERVAEIAADDDAPWVKIGDAVFRADSIRDEGSRVRIAATVRDNSVSRYLEALRSSDWGRGGQVQLTTTDRTGVASVEEVVSETTSRSMRRLTITAGVQWADGRPSGMASGTQGLTADDLTEISLRAGLFGDALPENLSSFGFMSVEPVDVIAPLRGEAISEGSFEPIARLLIVEHLLAGHKASAIEAFEIGPPHHGNRRLRLVYTEPSHASNIVPGVREIEGDWSV
jgi:hypothetical protein